MYPIGALVFSTETMFFIIAVFNPLCRGNTIGFCPFARKIPVKELGGRGELDEQSSPTVGISRKRIRDSPRGTCQPA